MMKRLFREYLKSEGYSEYSKNGNKSTVYDYSMRINRICEWEKLSWEELIYGIPQIIQKYDVGGSKEDIGKKSNHAYINALRAFQRFAYIIIGKV